MNIYSLSQLAIIFNINRNTIQNTARKLNTKVITKFGTSYVDIQEAECLIATIKPELNRRKIKQILESS